MKIEFLISTMNRNEPGALEAIFQHLPLDAIHALVVNQCTRIAPPQTLAMSNPNIRILSLAEHGLSRSRNTALDNACGEICVLVDDDCVLHESCLKDINAAYAANPDADIITFGSLSSVTRQPRKPAPKKVKRHSLFSIFGVSSIEITFRRAAIKHKALAFDERFGLGSRYPVAEENIFLKDCLDAGLRLYSHPALIVESDDQTTGYKMLNDPGLRGKVFRRAFANDALLLLALAYTSIRKYRYYKNQMGLFEYMRRMRVGAREFVRDQR